MTNHLKCREVRHVRDPVSDVRRSRRRRRSRRVLRNRPAGMPQGVREARRAAEINVSAGIDRSPLYVSPANCPFSRARLDSAPILCYDRGRMKAKGIRYENVRRNCRLSGQDPLRPSPRRGKRRGGTQRGPLPRPVHGARLRPPRHRGDEHGHLAQHRVRQADLLQAGHGRGFPRFGPRDGGGLFRLRIDARRPRPHGIPRLAPRLLPARLARRPLSRRPMGRVHRIPHRSRPEEPRDLLRSPHLEEDDRSTRSRRPPRRGPDPRRIPRRDRPHRKGTRGGDCLRRGG